VAWRTGRLTKHSATRPEDYGCGERGPWRVTWPLAAPTERLLALVSVPEQSPLGQNEYAPGVIRGWATSCARPSAATLAFTGALATGLGAEAAPDDWRLPRERGALAGLVGDRSEERGGVVDESSVYRDRYDRGFLSEARAMISRSWETPRRQWLSSSRYCRGRHGQAPR
jgi:hypothetical protein